ncbi:hypothetical protein Vadar_033473 [Vaccinium darrowii]|uniref:Uncharacterized protein n=1 Tax=Vaccinium darrowii TaxID=229202 RepID=A0ACB7Z967_9ERIC|nr:hypothetical protein Vadar_033473 [Vaccinium darrowii]
MFKVEIISKESVKPSSPTPDNLRTFRLSLLDQIIPPLEYTSYIQCYSHDKITSNVNQAEIYSLLKRSLSDALVLYYPFAGRLKDDSTVDCDDQGVDFFEARVDAYLSDIIQAAQIEELTQFAPRKSEEIGGVLLSIQLNYLNCGAIVIGITMSHKIVDGCAAGMFVKTWASIARGETDTVAPSFVAPSFFPPKETIPYDRMTGDDRPTPPPPTPWVDIRRFCFSSSKIAALRTEVVEAGNVVKPTRIELVTAALWKWVIAKKGRLSVASHLVNIRRRMDPPLSESAFGNLFRGVFALGDGEMDLGELITKMREATGKIDSEFLKEMQGENGNDMLLREFMKMGEYMFDKEVDCVMFTSWCGLPFYGWDFGWGKLAWVSPACRGYANNITLIDSVSDIGGIEAWIPMDGVDTTILEQKLLDILVE